jgi:hypothetical protein
LAYTLNNFEKLRSLEYLHLILLKSLKLQNAKVDDKKDQLKNSIIYSKRAAPLKNMW